MKSIIPICVSCIVLMVFTVSCDPLKPGYKECEEDGHTYYQFNLPFNYSPNTDTMQLGDTLWIESTFSNQLYNEHNGKTVTLVDFDFGVVGSMDDLSTNPTIGYPGFVLLDSSGNVDNVNRSGPTIAVKYTYKDNVYYWKKGIVLNKAGAFFTGFASPMTIDILAQSNRSITKCPNEHLILYAKPMNVTNNYYLLETSPDPYIRQGEYAYRNAFVFYVKE